MFLKKESLIYSNFLCNFQCQKAKSKSCEWHEVKSMSYGKSMYLKSIHTDF